MIAATKNAKKDSFYMLQALELAALGRYTTDPNPRVGCVIVKNKQVIATGWHQQAGQDHAEIVALKQLDNAKGATAYVTLEPCSHQGKTPPCCKALIKAGVTRVVVAMQDPNPLVAGQGLKKLKKAGIKVICGVLEAEAQALNRGFVSRMTQGKPFVRSKLAMSLDGRTAMASGESKWITGSDARTDVQRLRAESSVILTGINTVLADNPSLNVRLSIEVLQPIRVILDSSLQMPLAIKMAQLAGRSWILTCCNNHDKQRALEQVGFEVFVLPEKQGRLDLNAVFNFLATQQINEVLVEAGATLNGALLESGLVDEWIVYMAPVILGNNGRGLFNLPTLHTMANKKCLELQSTRQVGADLRLTFTQKSS